MTILAHSLACLLYLSHPLSLSRSPAASQLIHTHTYNLHRRFRAMIMSFCAHPSIHCVRSAHHMHGTQWARCWAQNDLFLCVCVWARACECVFFVLIKLHHTKWAFKEQKLRKITWFFSIRMYCCALSVALSHFGKCVSSKLCSFCSLAEHGVYSMVYCCFWVGISLDWRFRLYQEIGKRIMWNKSGSSYENGIAVP